MLCLVYKSLLTINDLASRNFSGGMLHVYILNILKWTDFELGDKTISFIDLI